MARRRNYQNVTRAATYDMFFSGHEYTAYEIGACLWEGNMKKAFTQDGLRHFTCKKCGRQVSLNVYRWRKTPQHLKNVCAKCLKKAELQRQTARERAADMGYYF